MRNIGISNKLLLLLALSGCASGGPLDDYEIDNNFIRQEFIQSETNKYGIVIRNRFYEPDESLHYDPYAINDERQIAALLTIKQYDTYIINADNPVDELWSILDSISRTSNDETKLFIAYTGKGDSGGLRTVGIFTSRAHNHCITRYDTTIRPNDLINALSTIRGQKAILINACESGIFCEEAENRRFNGIVIAACPRGFVTTPHEWRESSALYSTFLSLYEENLNIEIELSEINLGTVGGWWSNFLHSMSTGQLVASYEPVIYRNGRFRF